MKKIVLLLALSLLVALFIAPSMASAATLPANGAVVSDIPVHFATTDVVGTLTKAAFLVDGVQVALVKPTALFYFDDEGYKVITGYSACADVAVADGLNHTYEIKQGALSRYSGSFTVDADPIIVDHWYEGVGNASGAEYFKIINNGTNTTSNAYHYDKSGAGGSLVNVSSVTAGGITTVVRKLPHAAVNSDMLQMLYGGEIHGCSIKTTDGYSYPGDNMDMKWTPYADVEVCCPHWGDADPETVAEHEASCWHAVLEQAAGVYGP